MKQLTKLLLTIGLTITLLFATTIITFASDRHDPIGGGPECYPIEYSIFER